MSAVPSLPAALRAGIEALAAGHSGRDLATAAATLSADYRAGRGTRLAKAIDVAAYAAVRLPATYAATAAALAETAARVDFAPRSVIDLGCGPGTASWAALETFAGLDTLRLVDAHPGMLAVAQRLAAGGPAPLAAAGWHHSSIAAAIATESPADLVVASYAFNELPAADLAALAKALTRLATGLVVIVEPGTPQGFAVIAACRAALVAAGWRLVAPCPAEGPCPVTPPDWCHFAQRLPRLRQHRAAKGADAPFEDEPYSYIAAAAPHLTVHPAAARILAPPRATKAGTDLRICTPTGLAAAHIPARDREASRLIRRLGWGDAVPAGLPCASRD